MPGASIPGDAPVGTVVRLATGELARVVQMQGQDRCRVALADGAERVIALADAEVEPVRQRNQQRRDKVQAFQPGYVRVRVSHYDAASLQIVFRDFTSQAEADAYAYGKQMFGQACVPAEVEP